MQSWDSEIKYVKQNPNALWEYINLICFLKATKKQSIKNKDLQFVMELLQV
jgi:hypothetical protein